MGLHTCVGGHVGATCVGRGTWEWGQAVTCVAEDTRVGGVTREQGHAGTHCAGPRVCSPVMGCPPSYLGGSQATTAQSSPTAVTRTASGGSGTSAGTHQDTPGHGRTHQDRQHPLPSHSLTCPQPCVPASPNVPPVSPHCRDVLDSDGEPQVLSVPHVPRVLSCTAPQPPMSPQCSHPMSPMSPRPHVPDSDGEPQVPDVPLVPYCPPCPPHPHVSTYPQSPHVPTSPPCPPVSPRTNDLDEQAGGVLASGVGDSDDVSVLVPALGALDDQAAQLGPLLQPCPALTCCELLGTPASPGTPGDTRVTGDVGITGDIGSQGTWRDTRDKGVTGDVGTKRVT